MATAITTASPAEFRVRWWVAGDWNAFFGLFTNVVLNVLVLTTLVRFVIQVPDSIVFGRILPALGIALPLGNLYYAYLAYKLAKAEGRDNVTAMPYGPSVPHMFIVAFLIMLPVALATKNPILAWQTGLAWAFIIGLIVLLGAFVGPTIRKYTPRAAMLGTLAGISITFISMRPAFQSWEVPWIAFITLTIIMVSWMANVRLPGNLPGGLLAVAIGTAIAWVATMLGLAGVMQPSAVGEAFGQFGLRLPLPSGDVFVGLSGIGPLLVTAIPLGVYNFTEGTNNVESASAAGDSYNLRSILLADGAGAVIGSILGSPFPPAVYIGHPGWKAIGGRIGYSLATGACVAAICILGLVALLGAVIPLVAILPILVFIGIVIGAQAFQAVPMRHAPAVILALLPNIAQWAQGLVDGALGAAGTSANAPGIMEKLGEQGIVYHGMALLGGGGILAGMILAAVAAFIIDRDFKGAAIYALAGAVLAFFGFIHGTKLGFAESWQVALGYLLMAAICAGLAYREAPVKEQATVPAGAAAAEGA